MWGVSVTHPMLASFLCGQFLLHFLCWLYFSVGYFSYTSNAAFFFPSFFLILFFWGVPLTNPELVALFIAGDPLTHPVLASFLSGEFLLHIPCWLHFYVGSFSDTSHAGFTFIWLVCLTHPMLALLL